jgi:phosphatidylserine synthase
LSLSRIMMSGLLGMILSVCIWFQIRSPYLHSIIIIVIITISFMQGIYTKIPETNNVSKEYNVAAILSLLFMVPISLVPALILMYFYYYYYYYYYYYNSRSQ